MIMNKIEKGLQEAKEGKLEVVDISKLEKELDKKWSQWWYPTYHFLRYGIKNWLLEIKYRVPNFFHRAWYGWGKADVWGLDFYLSRIIYQSLIHLKKNKQGYPITIITKNVKDPNDIDSEANQKNWDKILNKMILAFKLANDIGSGGREFYSPKLSKEKQLKFKCLTKDEDQQIKEGMKLFIKHFFSLWD